MNHDAMIERLQAECDALVATVRNKNRGYGNDSAGPFHNFNIIEFLTDGKISAEVGIVVRMTDKLIRAYNLMAGQDDTVGEPLSDTLRDLAAYSLLALIAVDSKGENTDPIAEEKRRCGWCASSNCHGECVQNMASTANPTYGMSNRQSGLLDHSVRPQQDKPPLNEKQQSAWETLCAAFRGKE